MLLNNFLLILFLKFVLASEDIKCEDKRSQTKHNIKHVTYKAAVLEYEAYNEWKENEKGFGIIRKNAKNFASYASEAKKLVS